MHLYLSLYMGLGVWKSFNLPYDTKTDNFNTKKCEKRWIHIKTHMDNENCR